MNPRQIPKSYYPAPINIWVEDVLTKDYLTAVWDRTDQVAFFIAEGHGAIPPVVNDAREMGFMNVFGVRDRDFTTSNFSRWHKPESSPVFTLPRHECENYLLDESAVFGCDLHNRKRTTEEIAALMKSLAAQQVFWLACRKVKQEIRQLFLEDFPSDSTPIQIQTLAKALDCIIKSSWYRKMPNLSSNWSEPANVTLALNVAIKKYRKELKYGTWKSVFSGKEVFRAVRTFAYQPPVRDGKAASSVHDSAFAQSIGRWQTENRKVPADLAHLLACLRFRVGLGLQPDAPS